MKPCPLLALLMLSFSASLSAVENSPPLLEFASGLPGKQVQLSWSSEVGVRYRIERSTTLDAWSQIALVEATGTTTSWRDPEPTGAKAFYRVSQPQTEVFSISPPLLSSSGGTLVIRGQIIPAGSFLVLDVDGQLLQVPLSGAGGGLWNAVVTGQFAPGANATVVGIVDGTGATIVSLNLSLTVTGTGRALDGFVTLPPGAPVATDAAKKIPGIGVVVKKNPGGSAERTAGRKKLPPSLFAHNIMQRLQVLDNGEDVVIDNSSSTQRTAGGFVGNAASGGWTGLSKKGYEYYQNMSDFSSAGKKLANNKHPELMRTAASNPYFQNDGNPGSMPQMAIRGKVKDIKHDPGTMRCAGIPGEITVEACALLLETPAGPPLQVVHTYRSIGGSGTAGSHWEMCYDISVETIPAGAGSEAARVKICDGAGRCDVFLRQADGSYRCDGLFREGRFTGNVFTLTFADKGRWVFRPLGRVQAAGKISAITDRNGVSLSCDYDGVGRLATVSSQFGQSVSFTRGPDGTISRVTDQTGRYVSYGYFGAGDPNGNEGDLASISCPRVDGTPPAAGPTTFTYTTGNADENLNGNVLSVTDGAGRVLESFTYSAETDPLSIDYDKCASSNKTGHVSIARREIRPPGTSPEGGYTVFENDEVGRLTEVVYDRMHRPVSERCYTGFCTPGVAVTSASNRPTGKLRATDPDFFETTCVYNADSLCTLMTTPDGSQEATTYDRDFRKDCPVVERGNGRVTTLRTPAGEERTVRCDFLPGFGTFEAAYHEVKSPRDAASGLATGIASARSRDKGQTWEFHPASRVAITAMDDWESQVVRIVSAYGQVTTCGYDARGNLTSVTSPVAGRGSLYNYNELGQCTSAAELNGAGPSFLDTFIYNPASHFPSGVVCDSTGLQFTTILGRDALGRVTSTTDPRGSVWQCAYNALDQVVHTASPAVPVSIGTDFTYDAGGLLARCDTEQRGSDGLLVSANPAYSTFWVYDSRARLVRVAEEGRPVDCSGLLVPDTLGIENFSACDITYNDAGECSRLSTPAGCRAQTTDLVCDFTYDERGMIRRTIQGGLGNADACTTECDYSPAGLLTRCAILGDGADSVSLSSYDGFQRLSSETDPMGNVCTYDYDNQGYVTCSVYGEVNDVPGSSGNVLLARYKKKNGSFTCGDFNYRIIAPVNNHAINTKGAGANDRFASTPCGGMPIVKVTDRSSSPSGLLLPAVQKREISHGAGGAGPHVRLLLPAVQKLRDSAARIIGASCGGGPRVEAFFSFETEDETITCDRFTPGGGSTSEVTTIDLSPAGLVQQISCNGDLLETRSYDTAGRLVSSFDGACSFSFTLDGNGCATACTRTDISKGAGIPTKTFTVTNVLDALGRCIQTTDGTGNISSCAFDSLDRCVSFTDPSGFVTRCAYDGSSVVGPFSEEISADAQTPGTFVVLSRCLVRSGELRSTTDSYGHTTTFSSNALGCPIRCDLPDGTFETRTYDRKINLNTIGHVDHGRTTITRDLNGRPVTTLTTSDPNNAPVSSTPIRTFSYDGLGRCVNVVQGVHSVGFGFDSLGNCVSETQDGRTVSRSYSHRGKTGITYQDGRSFVETRDGLGLLLSISAVSGGVPVTPPVVVNEYAGARVARSTQADGSVTTFQYRGDGEAALGTGPDFSFDDLVSQSVSSGSSHLHQQNIIHRDLAARVIRTDAIFSDAPAPPSRSKVFVRNRQGHVMVCTTRRRPTAGAQPVIESEVSYTRDLEGRRLSASGGVNPGLYTQSASLPPGDQQMGQYTTGPRGPLEWDDNGNLISMPTATGTLSLTHDVEGRLTSVSRSGVPVISYDYDPLGRCISRTPAAGAATTFVYDGGECVQELGADGLADLSLVCDGAIKQCISTRNGTVYYPHGGAADRKGLVSYGGNIFPVFRSLQGTCVTSSNGTVVERFDCDDAGKPIFLTSDGSPTSATGSSIGLRWMSPEAAWEPEIGMFTCPGGVYSPDLGRVVSMSVSEAKPQAPREFPSRGFFR